MSTGAAFCVDEEGPGAIGGDGLEPVRIMVWIQSHAEGTPQHRNCVLLSVPNALSLEIADPERGPPYCQEA